MAVVAVFGLTLASRLTLLCRWPLIAAVARVMMAKARPKKAVA